MKCSCLHVQVSGIIWAQVYTASPEGSSGTVWQQVVLSRKESPPRHKYCPSHPGNLFRLTYCSLGTVIRLAWAGCSLLECCSCRLAVPESGRLDVAFSCRCELGLPVPEGALYCNSPTHHQLPILVRMLFTLQGKPYGSAVLSGPLQTWRRMIILLAIAS